MSLFRVSQVLLMFALVGCSPHPPPPINNLVIYICFQAVFLTMALTPDLGLVPRHCTGAANGSPGLQVTRRDMPSYMCPHELTQMSCVLCVSNDIFNLLLNWDYREVNTLYTKHTKHTHTLFSVRIHPFYRRKI